MSVAEIRTATEDDLPSLRSIYVDSVRALAPGVYTAEQVEAWATFTDTGESFRRFILDATTYVALEHGLTVGFCGIEGDGHVASLYVAARAMRRGVGSRLLAWAIEHAPRSKRVALYVEASEFSMPLFSKFGFVLTRKERAPYNGVEFDRYAMSRAAEEA